MTDPSTRATTLAVGPRSGFHPTGAQEGVRGLSVGFHRPQRSGRGICRVIMLLAGLSGCATSSAVSPSVPPQAIPQAHGSYYTVQPGETLWRIAHDFGLDVHALAATNRLPDVTQVKTGQRLFIPAPKASNHFLWPVRGRTSRHGSDGQSIGQGVQIQAPEGSFVRASRTGRVAVATRRLQGWGKTVLLDHGDGYVSVYAGLEQLLVNPGLEVRQGNPVGRLGREPLYFEIRYGATPSDSLQLLP